MPGPPSFDSSQGDTVVPRERSDPGASSTAALVRLSPGPGAAPLRTLTEEPTVAHVPESDDTGYMVMYSSGRTLTVDDRSAWPRTGRVVCPHFELQPGIPADRCLSIHLPRTDLDKQGLIQARRKATICGTMISVVQQYLWDTAELLEGCATGH